VAGFGVNVLTPLAGVMLYLLLRREMRRRSVPDPPDFAYLILFSAYGGWLMILLTAHFWRWSGMASLGGFYLVAMAPFFMAGIAIFLHKQRSMSGFHRIAYIASISYCVLMLILVGGSVLVLSLFPGFLEP